MLRLRIGHSTVFAGTCPFLGAGRRAIADAHDQHPRAARTAMATITTLLASAEVTLRLVPALRSVACVRLGSLNVLGRFCFDRPTGGTSESKKSDRSGLNPARLRPAPAQPQRRPWIAATAIRWNTRSSPTTPESGAREVPGAFWRRRDAHVASVARPQQKSNTRKHRHRSAFLL